MGGQTLCKNHFHAGNAKKVVSLVVTGFFMLIGCLSACGTEQIPANTNQHEHSGCGCGTVDYHYGVDLKSKEGSPVQVADGVVVKIEENENAIVYAATGGFCGRYIVVKHSYPNGRSVYTRYAQLGKIADKDGKLITVGAHVNAGDKLGELGKKALLHLEIRPENQDAKVFTSIFYQNDKSMEWSQFQPVNPNEFDFDEFAGRTNSSKPMQQVVSKQKIEDAKPATVSIASIKSNKAGVHVTAYAVDNVSVSKFLRQLAQNDISATIAHISPITVCGNRMVRFELDMVGDTSSFGNDYENKGGLRIVSSTGAEFHCQLQVR